MYAASAPLKRVFNGITTAPDNKIYYTALNDKIGRLSNLGAPISEISLAPGSNPGQIVRGPDGNLWFAETGTSKIGQLSPASFSVINEFPTNSGPVGITVGQDGALWFTELQGRIGRITTTGTVTEFPTPSTSSLMGIFSAPDGSLWFCEASAGKIGKLVY